MRWSIEELIQALKLHRSYSFKRWLIELPIRFWRRLKTLVKWIFTGYTDVSLWDLSTFLTDVIVFRLGKFIDLVDKSYPPEFKDWEDWVRAVEEMYTCWNNMQNSKIKAAALDEIGWEDKTFIDEDGGYKSPYTKEEKEFLNRKEKEQQENDKKALSLLMKYYFDLWD